MNKANEQSETLQCSHCPTPVDQPDQPSFVCDECGLWICGDCFTDLQLSCPHKQITPTPRFEMIDEVNRPSHYTSHESGIECIDVIRNMPFNRGNAIKYVWRAGLKDPQHEIKDLRKAIWYIQDAINDLETKAMDEAMHG